MIIDHQHHTNNPFISDWGAWSLHKGQSLQPVDQRHDAHDLGFLFSHQKLHRWWSRPRIVTRFHISRFSHKLWYSGNQVLHIARFIQKPLKFKYYLLFRKYKGFLQFNIASLYTCSPFSYDMTTRATRKLCNIKHFYIISRVIFKLNAFVVVGCQNVPTIAAHLRGGSSQ